MRRLLIIAVGVLLACSETARPAAPLRVSVFSRTRDYRHDDSIAAGISALSAWAERAGFALSATEDPAQLTSELAQRDVIVFLQTTGDVLDESQQIAFEAFIRGGGGYVGVHAAADTEYDWPFYGELIGAWFDSHPDIQPATVHVELGDHLAATGLPDPWERSDEWYNFRENPRVESQVVLTLDESSYQGGAMGTDHPIAWCHEVGEGRAFYTALGHAGSAWSEPLFRQHVQNAVLWAGKRPAE